MSSCFQILAEFFNHCDLDLGRMWPKINRVLSRVICNNIIGVTSHVLAVISRILALQKSLTAGGAFSRKFISLPYFEIAAILVYFPDLV